MRNKGESERKRGEGQRRRRPQAAVRRPVGAGCVGRSRCSRRRRWREAVIAGGAGARFQRFRSLASLSSLSLFSPSFLRSENVPRLPEGPRRADVSARTELEPRALRGRPGVCSSTDVLCGAYWCSESAHSCFGHEIQVW